MPMGIDILGISALLVMASSSDGVKVVNKCAQVPAAPTVQVRIIEEDLNIFTNRSGKELAALQAGAQDGDAVTQAYLDDGHAMLGGLTNSNVTVDHKVYFKTYSDKKSGFGCISVQHVDMVLRLDPTVYVAKEYRDNACRFREVHNHEMLHVATDRQVLAKYKGRLTDGLNMLFSMPEDYASGVIRAADMNGAQRDIEKIMNNAVSVLFDDIQRDRAAAQHRVDSPYEYARIKRACGN